MQLKGLAFTLGVGAAVGAVAVMLMPKNNPARKLACQAASKVEDLANKMSSTLSDKMDA